MTLSRTFVCALTHMHEAKTMDSGPRRPGSEPWHRTLLSRDPAHLTDECPRPVCQPPISSPVGDPGPVTLHFTGRALGRTCGTRRTATRASCKGGPPPRQPDSLDAERQMVWGTTPRAASGDCSRQRKGPWAQGQKEGLQVPLSLGCQGKQEELSCDSSRPGSPEERPVSLLQGGKPPEVHPGGCLIPDVRCIGGTH